MLVTARERTGTVDRTPSSVPRTASPASVPAAVAHRQRAVPWTQLRSRARAMADRRWHRDRRPAVEQPDRQCRRKPADRWSITGRSLRTVPAARPPQPGALVRCGDGTDHQDGTRGRAPRSTHGGDTGSSDDRGHPFHIGMAIASGQRSWTCTWSIGHPAGDPRPPGTRSRRGRAVPTSDTRSSPASPQGSRRTRPGTRADRHTARVSGSA